ncbi:unnamed protein product [marine sediment metagenome]|uniref:Uncharacterized protein n=1 Tax=marine sediment metagenome TaxID=412755 RepID=X0SE87_9ZZZZ
MIENSKIMKNILNTLLTISSRKETDINIVSTMVSLVKKLEGKYSFLKHVEINDTRFFEAGDSITVMSDLDSVPSNEMGKAIHDIIFSMVESLGSNAGYYFIKEIGHRIGDDYYTTIRDDLGVNLSHMQLEWDVSRMERRLADRYTSE